MSCGFSGMRWIGMLLLGVAFTSGRLPHPVTVTVLAAADARTTTEGGAFNILATFLLKPMRL